MGATDVQIARALVVMGNGGTAVCQGKGTKKPQRERQGLNQLFKMVHQYSQ